MNENEIIKALECCVQYKTTDVRTYKGMSLEVFSEATLDLINRQKAEIDHFADIGKMYSEIRAEAVKEFVEKLIEERLAVILIESESEEYAKGYYDSLDYVEGKVGDLVKEMVGDV